MAGGPLLKVGFYAHPKPVRNALLNAKGLERDFGASVLLWRSRVTHDDLRKCQYCDKNNIPSKAKPPAFKTFLEEHLIIPVNTEYNKAIHTILLGKFTKTSSHIRSSRIYKLLLPAKRSQDRNLRNTVACTRRKAFDDK